MSKLLNLYVERFNRRDWDGLRELIAADAQLRVVDKFTGRVDQSPYFGNYERWPVPWQLAVGEVDGEPVIIILLRESDGATGTKGRSSRPRRRPYYFHRRLSALPVGAIGGDLRRRGRPRLRNAAATRILAPPGIVIESGRQFQEEKRCKQKRPLNSR